MNNQKFPNTDSIQELAQFWDTHDITDFADDLEQVNETVFEREPTMIINLLPEELKAVKQLAKSRGIPYPDLVSEWVREKLKAG